MAHFFVMKTIKQKSKKRKQEISTEYLKFKKKEEIEIPGPE